MVVGGADDFFRVVITVVVEPWCGAREIKRNEKKYAKSNTLFSYMFVRVCTHYNNTNSFQHSFRCV